MTSKQPDSRTAIPARAGAPYIIERHRKHIHLTRTFTWPDGKVHTVRLIMDKLDATNVCNGIMDAFETSAVSTGPCNAPA